MQKVSAFTTTATTDGKFTNGSVSTGVTPTILDAGWFNAVQDELVGAIEGAGLTLDASSDVQLLAAIKALIAAKHGVKTFSAAGSFTVPADIYTVYVSGIGGGGGGGGGGGCISGTSGAGGGGGGVGSFTFKKAITVTPGQVIAVTIGAGGSAGAAGTSTANGGNGGAGGATSFGSLLTLSGGAAGSGAQSATSSNASVAGGAAGAGGGAGSDGSKGYSLPLGIPGIGSGSPFGSTGPHSRSGDSSGGGGATPVGYGGGGGGGGGAYSGSTASSGGPGGAGAPGFLIVEW